MNWRDSAACRGTFDPRFFPYRGGTSRYAKLICAGCDVQADCLNYSLTNSTPFGVWGGLNERERRKARRQREAA